MSELTTGIALVGLLLALIGVGVPIAVAMIGLSFVGVIALKGSFPLAMSLLATTAESGVSEYVFVSIPLFVLMGCLISAAKVGRDTFEGIQVLVRRLPGGLAIATVLSNAVFAAVTGISVASAAVFSKIAVPEMLRFGYSTRLAVGAVAGSSILGMLIPPSILLIIYGVLAEQAIGKLFVAAVLPGLAMTAAFIAVILFAAWLRPTSVGSSSRRPTALQLSASGAVVKLVPIVLLIALMLGGLYGGIFSPTEAGGVGAAGALALAISRKRISWRVSSDILRQSAVISANILVLLLGAAMYSRMLTMSGLPDAIVQTLSAQGISPFVFFALLVGLLLALGCFLDSASILLLTVPVAAPIAKSLGIDLIQLGVVFVIAVEIGLLTPPFGLSVYVVHSTLKSRNIPLRDIFIGCMLFICAMLAVLAVVILVPSLSTALVR